MNRYSNVPKPGGYFTSSKNVSPAIKKSIYSRGINNPGVNSLVRGTSGVVDVKRESSVEGSTFRKIDKTTSIIIDKKGKTTLINNTETSDCPISMINEMLDNIPSDYYNTDYTNFRDTNFRDVSSRANNHRRMNGSRYANNHQLNLVNGIVDRRPGVKRIVKVPNLVGLEVNRVGAVDYKPNIPHSIPSVRINDPSVRSVVKDLPTSQLGRVQPSKIASKTIRNTSQSGKNTSQSSKNRRPQPKTLIRTIAQPTNTSSRLPSRTPAIEEDLDLTEPAIRPQVQKRVNLQKTPLLPSPSISELVSSSTTDSTTNNKQKRQSRAKRLSKRLSRGSGVSLPIIYKSLIRPQLKIDSIDVADNSTLSVKLSNVGTKDTIRVGLGGVTLANQSKITDNGIYVESSQGYWHVKGLCNNKAKLCPVKANQAITFRITNEYIDIHIDRVNHIVRNFSLNYIPVVESNNESKASASYSIYE